MKRTARRIIEEYATELIERETRDKTVADKLLVIEVIAMRMSWNDLYNRVRFRKKFVPYWID